ncbi:hypothetical protein RN001_010506 [Aquatica leii]|uniref:Uncharacterized protein n=1 Tax=Aquatica leii TaxID=1421715 RepID=A0AAN7Q3B9_9COLE|nr:hypothetical protein RN001_010506 [Aquatica leii]
MQLLQKLFMKEKWMQVPLNHFDLFDNRTWNMRYIVRDDHYREGGPLFIEVGGEWTIDGLATIMGNMADLAQEHHGMMIETEHRYYGQSLPFGEDFSTEKLEFLQIEQAIEDLAYFIDHFKEENPKLKDAKVIVHGCSYPGMLVTWLRLRFPHIVDIAYASSAPLGVGLDYPEFFEVVNDVYANVSDACIETIRQGFNQTTELMKTEEGRKRVRQAFKDWTCGDVEEMNSVEILSKVITVLNVMHDPSQYEEVACLVMTMDSDDEEAFKRLANFVIFKSKHIASCSTDTEEEGDAQRNGVSWAYQTCTEMGTFQTLNRKNSHHPFQMDMSVDESVEECVKQFSGIVTENVLRTGIERVTRRYGGTKPKVSKVITIQGTNDPWKHLATLEDYNDEAPVWIMEGSHCADVTKRDDDSQGVKDIRVKVKALITKWIKDISH